MGENKDVGIEVEKGVKKNKEGNEDDDKVLRGGSVTPQ